MQPDEIIELRFLVKPKYSKEIIEKYLDGFSARDIAKHFSCSKQKVLRTLKKNKINMRPSGVVTTRAAFLQRKSKNGSKPFYYGFCYFEGKLTKHPIEFPVLLIIHRLWAEGKSIHQINLDLNKQKIKSREGKIWSWVAIRNIVQRFEKKILIIKDGGEYDLK